MNILLCHNYYQQRGGEDLSFEAEARLLEAKGHQVRRFTLHNDAVRELHPLRVVGRTFWNRDSHRQVRRLIEQEQPDVMHCTNIFPLISPAVYSAAKAEGVPVVQSLRNYRLLCPNAYLLRENRVCEDCLGKMFAWPGVLHGCYRGSRAASAVVAGMSALHRGLRTWQRKVDVYFTPTEFARRQFLRAGFPAEKLLVKPNFIDPDPGLGDGDGDYAVFVGRLSAEKGIATLLAAWSDPRCDIPLKIIGDGPLAADVQAAARENPRLEWLGARPSAEVLEIIGHATVLVMPSLWYETFGRTIIEAFAKGTPVVASRLGCMEELVHDNVTGLLFEPGRPSDLVAQVRRLLAEPAALATMRRAARAEFLGKYTADPNYDLLMEIYARAGARQTPAAPTHDGPRTSDLETVLYHSEDELPYS